jgi:hypothetical protein
VVCLWVGMARVGLGLVVVGLVVWVGLVLGVDLARVDPVVGRPGDRSAPERVLGRGLLRRRLLRGGRHRPVRVGRVRVVLGLWAGLRELGVVRTTRTKSTNGKCLSRLMVRVCSVVTSSLLPRSLAMTSMRTDEGQGVGEHHSVVAMTKAGSGYQDVQPTDDPKLGL